MFKNTNSLPYCTLLCCALWFVSMPTSAQTTPAKKPAAQQQKPTAQKKAPVRAKATSSTTAQSSTKAQPKIKAKIKPRVNIDQVFAELAKIKMKKRNPIARISLSQPLYSHKAMLAWGEKAAVESFNYSYQNYPVVFKQLRNKYFDGNGWKRFRLAMWLSALNLGAISKNKMILQAKIVGKVRPATIIDDLPLDGHYTWKVVVPLIVTYKTPNASAKAIIDVTLRLMRITVLLKPVGVAVENYSIRVIA